MRYDQNDFVVYGWVLTTSPHAHRIVPESCEDYVVLTGKNNSSMAIDSVSTSHHQYVVYGQPMCAGTAEVKDIQPHKAKEILRARAHYEWDALRFQVSGISVKASDGTEFRVPLADPVFEKPEPAKGCFRFPIRHATRTVTEAKDPPVKPRVLYFPPRL